jgi:hypothetical protein
MSSKAGRPVVMSVRTPVGGATRVLALPSAAVQMLQQRRATSPTHAMRRRSSRTQGVVGCGPTASARSSARWSPARRFHRDSSITARHYVAVTHAAVDVRHVLDQVFQGLA